MKSFVVKNTWSRARVVLVVFGRYYHSLEIPFFREHFEVFLRANSAYQR